MKWFAATIALWVFSHFMPVQAADRPVYLRTAWISGQEYVNLGDWAQARGFQMFWPLHGDDITISSRWAKLSLKTKSRVISLNGASVTLSLPLVAQRDTLYISRLDLRTLIHPILYPGRPDRPKKVLTVALDPGHGGKDPGNEAAGEQEKKHTLLLAKEVQKRLTQAGVKAVLTRSADTYVENHDRPALAKKLKADIFVSLHYNSVPSGRSDVSGIEVYCLTPATTASTNDPRDSGPHGAMPGNRNDEQNALLAYTLQKQLLGLGLNDRGLKHARYTVLCYAEMPSVLVEGGFMSEPREAKRIVSQAYRRQLATAIVDGILAYKRLIERPAAAKK
jgi:N-acetylmuramoyl-L-alanine amidase